MPKKRPKPPRKRANKKASGKAKRARPRKIQKRRIPARPAKPIRKAKAAAPPKAARVPHHPKPPSIQIVDRRRQRTPSIQSRDFLLSIRKEIAEAFGTAAGIKAEEILPLIERPPEGIEADFAVPCFTLARQMRKAPQEIAKDVVGKISPVGVIKEARLAGPYVNFLVEWKKVAQEAIPHILLNERYGSSEIGRGKIVIVDFSSPNTAKPMSIGHLRSTVIGDSLCRIHRNLGYKVIGDNHLGDWGTQFGKIIIGYKRWGKPENLEKNPIDELLRVYVKFHEEAEIDPKLEDQARQAFKRLEDGEKEHVSLWKKFSDLSNREFKRTYDMLGVRFDLWLGESFYNKMAKEVIEDSLKKKVGKWSEHALIIELQGQTPLVIRKSDEATLYSTRDLATIKYRLEKFKPDKMLYVIGSEQRDYLLQVLSAAERLGYINPEQRRNLIHVSFGMVSLPEGKMSTRKGKVVFLDHVIEEVTKMAEKTIEAKNPSLRNREGVAKQVGIGAIKYADLSRDRIKDIRFDWNEMLSFEGDTGPYIQYTHARAASILRKAKAKAPPKKIDSGLLSDPKEKAIVRKLCEFPEAVRRAGEDCKPHYLANYVCALANLFNEFYQAVPVLRSEGNLRSARIALVMATKKVLKDGLDLLGIEAPEEM